MANYSNATDIGYQIGKTISATTVPSTTGVADLQDKMTALINAEVRVSTNMTDTYGELAEIETDLVCKKIRNIWSYTNPDDFPYEEVVLSADQKRTIHRCHTVSRGTSWELGG